MVTQPAPALGRWPLSLSADLLAGRAEGVFEHTGLDRRPPVACVRQTERGTIVVTYAPLPESEADYVGATGGDRDAAQEHLAMTTFGELLEAYRTDEVGIHTLSTTIVSRFLSPLRRSSRRLGARARRSLPC